MTEPLHYYVTTPIYYVNDRPHIGHAYTTILADVLANYHRLLGVPTWFLTGTDEHGQKVQQAAEKKGITPQQQCDDTVVRFRELWERLEITHDDFIRTTEERHTTIVQAVLQDLYDRGEIYRAEYEGWYCVGCERFYTEKDLVEGRCPECDRAVDPIRESNYFFRMSRYRDWLIEYIQSHPGFIRPDFRANETLGFLKQPLQDLCISRPKTRLTWGIELPFDRDFVTYVWFDALLNYVTAVGYGSDDERFRRWWPASCHLIGKDILTTHTVYWPTMLKAMGLPMPESIFAHGWWLTGRTKMSKSLGNVVNPMEMIERYGVDPFRYFLIAEMKLGQDASFTEEAFITRYNSDLANDLGNLLSRVLNMLHRYCGGTIPAVDAEALEGDEEQEVWALTQKAVDAMEAAVPAMELDSGLASVMEAVRGVNRYLERKSPWTRWKEGAQEDVALTLYAAAESLRVAAALLYPVMPAKMLDLRAALGMERRAPEVRHLRNRRELEPGSAVERRAVLFPRAEMAEETGAAAGKPAAPPEKKEGISMETITIDDFAKVQLKTARIESAERIEGTDKLMKLQVDLGDEPRQLVAGIAAQYAPEDLPGKTVVVVANLKPARLRGVESQGMVLAASKGDRLCLLSPESDLGPGADVR
ncbi:methionine--tRNA ligase [Kiritimatiella glycovorans]|uniref:Methionine--tRNA ligase n=1 Tax=Kiritimatiella glycovorans TaxID=1307763 RepID=A0A0G3EF15_9BACT|nr:methionine--tRNA ligase [Kiritimatiella glycovorans]AKJ65046.1 Methionine--tRNA ligase [Kiritimatiella glycovorans]